ncbi:hypothetical protein GOODEAATRI_033058 [Goodea atripinnis]|uniref:Uncharacterized protein n=1 Tax=Goodea atripinnis TaxID=208336 RepID=A0ABV0P9P9_9TELE
MRHRVQEDRGVEILVAGDSSNDEDLEASNDVETLVVGSDDEDLVAGGRLRGRDGDLNPRRSSGERCRNRWNPRESVGEARLWKSALGTLEEPWGALEEPTTESR